MIIIQQILHLSVTKNCGHKEDREQRQDILRFYGIFFNIELRNSTFYYLYTECACQSYFDSAVCGREYQAGIGTVEGDL